MSNNFWSHKPWWCQPWSILLTGSLAIAGSWLLLHIWWLSGGVALVVLAWWLLFLVVVPYTTPVEETEAKTP
ncbi:MAG: hypothetical protein RLZZ158_1715 [Cyanobacteriota bacterium]|jgi:hypothetical protein